MSLVPLTESLLSDRKAEVTAYLEFLKVAVERHAVLNAKDGVREISYPMSLELTHTLKANLFLLLYSATEATLVQLLDEMHETIGNNCSNADALNVELRRVILSTFKKDDQYKFLNDLQPLHSGLFSYWINDWRRRTSAKEKRLDGISGSVDGRVFYDQLRKFGVVAKTEDDKPHGHLTDADLQLVKNKRNQLAHGETSFTDLGREFAVDRLDVAAQAVFNTLQTIAAEVNDYLQNRRYLAQPVPLAQAEVVERTDA